jgi:hypothetical protein
MNLRSSQASLYVSGDHLREHEARTGPGRAVGAGGAAPATTSPRGEKRSSIARRESVPTGHHLRAQDGHLLERPAGRGVRVQRGDMLEKAARVEPSRSLREAATGTVGRVGAEGAHRLEPGLVRLQQRAGDKRGPQTGPNPTDRGKAGSKHHLVVDRRGLPLAILLSAANVHDKREALPLLDAILPIKGPRGRPRRRPGKGHGDKGYDYADIRRGLRQRHIVPRIPAGAWSRRSGWDSIAGWWSAPWAGSTR